MHKGLLRNIVKRLIKFGRDLESWPEQLNFRFGTQQTRQTKVKNPTSAHT